MPVSRARSPRPAGAAALCLAALALGGCASSGYTALRIPAPKGPPVSLDQANRWWQGASARLMTNVSFLKKPKNGVWCAVIEVPRAGHAPNSKKWQDLKLIIHVPDAPAVRQAIDKQGMLYAGTLFQAQGWGVTRLEKEDLNVLRLQMAGASQPSSIYFSCYDWKNFVFFNANDCSLDGVRQRAEPYLRAHFFQLGQPTPARQAAPRALEAAASVRVVSVAVEPLRVARGGTVQLLITYQVEGVPLDSPAALIERRRIQQEGRTLLDQSATVPHSAGTFTSQQTVQIPGSTAAGAYTFRADVSLGAASSSKEGLFEVRE